MRKILPLTAVLALLQTAAMAHDTGAPHLHPHGVGVVLAGCAIAFAGYAMYRSASKSEAKAKDDSYRLKK